MTIRKNVFIVGHPRAGTTLLASGLQPYFQFSSLGKEPRFFDYRNTKLDCISNDDYIFKKYQRSFKGSTKTIDANPWNFGERSAKAIKKFFPNAYIIITTRNPYERALSHYKMYVRQAMISNRKFLSIENLLSNYNEQEFLDYDTKNFDNNFLISTNCPTDIIRASDSLKTYSIYSQYFDKDKIFIFDLDSDESNNMLSKNLSNFLDEEIKFDKSKVINRGNKRPNTNIRKYLKKFSALRNRIPISIDEKIKNAFASIFPEKEIYVTKNDKLILESLTKNLSQIKSK